ncbi:hypothetical protein SOVF_140770, partial [Spinacia oleracea]
MPLRSCAFNPSGSSRQPSRIDLSDDETDECVVARESVWLDPVYCSGLLSSKPGKDWPSTARVYPIVARELYRIRPGYELIVPGEGVSKIDPVLLGISFDHQTVHSSCPDFPKNPNINPILADYTKIMMKRGRNLITEIDEPLFPPLEGFQFGSPSARQVSIDMHADELEGHNPG